MPRFGYTLMTEQSGPRDLVRYAAAAEDAGFDFEVCSDHYSPWLVAQGHAPYAWTVRVWDAPDGGLPIGIAVSGEKSVSRFAPLADHVIAVEPDPELIKNWDEEKGTTTSRKIGQIPICWDTDRDRAVERAHEQFRWFAGGWAVNADLPTPAGFEGASQFVRPDDIAEAISCGPDLDAIAEKAKTYVDAGFTDLAIVQVGDEGQTEFLDEAAQPLLKALRAI